MSVNNWPKLILLLTFAIGLFALVITGKSTTGDVDKYFTLMLGYIVGNGIAAKRNEPVEPVLTSKDDRNGNYSNH